MIRKGEIVVWGIFLFGHILRFFLREDFYLEYYNLFFFWPVAIAYLIGGYWFFQKKDSAVKYPFTPILAGVGTAFLFSSIPFAIERTAYKFGFFDLTLIVGFGLLITAVVIALAQSLVTKERLRFLLLKTTVIAIYTTLVMFLPRASTANLVIKKYYLSTLPSKVAYFDMQLATKRLEGTHRNGTAEEHYALAHRALVSGYRSIYMDTTSLVSFIDFRYNLSVHSTPLNYGSTPDFRRDLFKIGFEVDNFHAACLRLGRVQMTEGKYYQAHKTLKQPLIHLEAMRKAQVWDEVMYSKLAFEVVTPAAESLLALRGFESADSFLVWFRNINLDINASNSQGFRREWEKANEKIQTKKPDNFSGKP